MRKTLEECDRKGDHDSEEFQKASKIFYSHYLCRLDPLPEEVQMVHEHIKEDNTTYVTM